ncbi:scaffold protein Nfu/NifU N terminal-domain-containing protein [Lipomyces japonicus]|uniref:scaffold protein Nfu/NifU N terminal-domain-containing protein n=1 Tax=Lipomyces japonicus TaxID=56871 RepID=UPI0034CD95DA
MTSSCIAAQLLRAASRRALRSHNGTRYLSSTPATFTISSIIGHDLKRQGASINRSWLPLSTGKIMQSRSLFIQTATTPNDDALKFMPSTRILPENARTVEFINGREAHSSPLARKLFTVDGVRSVMFGPDFITVEKQSDVPWAVLKPEVFSLLTEFLSTGAKILLEDTQINEDTMPQEDDSEIVSMIKELIDTRIRPAIQEDGGDVEYKGLTEEGVVQLKLRGACRTCDSSSVTLKNGIEAMLMHYVDGVTGIEQVLDPEEEISLQEFAKFEQKLKQAKSDSL